MVVADHGQHAAVGRGAEGVGVLEHVHAAVEPRPLAVPQAEHAVVLCARKQPHLLTTPDRGHRQVFVNAGQKMNIVRLGKVFGLPQGLVEPADWRAAITRDETGRVEAAIEIALMLQDG